MNQNPNPKAAASQRAKLLRWLERGKSITPGQAMKKWGCFRLGARIHELINEGHNITSKLVVVPTRNGKTRVSRYRLEEAA